MPKSLDNLKELVLEEKLSESELNVLFLALDGNSTQEIAKKLNIPTENAVQKRLGKVYAKFRLTGAGPGKLHQLEKIIEDRQDARKRNKQILIFWSGELGKKQAEGLKDTILKHPSLDSYVIAIDMANSRKWRNETEKVLDTADCGIACLGQGREQDPLVTLALGFLDGKLSNFKLVRFSPTKLPKTLSQFVTVDGTQKEKLGDLLHEMGVENAQTWVNYQLSASYTSQWWEEMLEAERQLIAQQGQDRPTQVTANSQLVVEAGRKIIKDNIYFKTNEIFQEIIDSELLEVGEKLEKLGIKGESYEFFQELYPYYLVTLQKKFKLLVKAVAIIDGSENFWHKYEGEKIAETSHPKSERLFVFSNKQSLLNSKEWLVKHATRYKVYIMTSHDYAPLAEEFYHERKKETAKEKIKVEALPTKKYAIIRDEFSDENQLLIWYDEADLNNDTKRIMTKVCLSSYCIKKYQEAFEKIKNASNILPLDSQKIENFQELAKGLFSSQNTIASNTSKLLKNLQKLRQKLIHCQKTEEVMDVAVREVTEIFSSQSAAFFLFAKDGKVHRRKIHGYDRDGQLVTDCEPWFPEENYEENDSLTGRAAAGSTQWTNQLNQEAQLIAEQHKKYLRKFGDINCAIAIPLKGQNRSFGVLRIINKVDPETKMLKPYCGFVGEDIKYLEEIGYDIATRYSELRRREQEKICQKFTEFLTTLKTLKDFTDKVTKRLVADDLPFAVCILRVWDDNEHLSIASIHSADNKEISIEINSRKSQEEIAKATLEQYKPLINKVVKTGEPLIIKDIEKDKEKFSNQLWIEENGLKSYACYPLISKISEQPIVGTLAVYTAYHYEFYPSCRKFLENIAGLIAAFIQQTQLNQNSSRNTKDKKTKATSNLPDNQPSHSNSQTPNLEPAILLAD